MKKIPLAENHHYLKYPLPQFMRSYYIRKYDKIYFALKTAIACILLFIVCFLELLHVLKFIFFQIYICIVTAVYIQGKVNVSIQAFKTTSTWKNKTKYHQMY